MPKALVTWSDRGADPGPPRERARKGDLGPVLRLVSQREAGPYERAFILTTREGRAPADQLADELRRHVKDPRVRSLQLTDPSDYGRMFRALGPVVEELRAEVKAGWELDVLLSAGTPQAQTLWVILVQAGLLPARMLQIIPPQFVPHPHPKAVREVTLEVEGFPEIRALRAEVKRLRSELRPGAATLLGDSDAMRELRARLSRVAASEVPVLILGETGTGKELAARALHDGGDRARGPFVAENCAAFAEGVLASELFGHEPGAFTGAAGRRRGLFELAHGGTLFLDEVAELEPRAQAHLLRVLQEGTLRRVGGEKDVRVDVRVIAATHRDLPALVQKGRFREDLYYRLRGAVLELPPLRARSGDVRLLALHVLRERGSKLRISPEALRVLERYAWPGNVRELRAEALRWTVFCEREVRLLDLPPEIALVPLEPQRPAARSRPAPPASARTLAEAVAEAERTQIAQALAAHGGKLRAACKALAIDRNTLRRKVRGYGL